MYIKYSKLFLSRFQKLPLHDKQHVRDALVTFEEDPFDPSLNNHALRKPLAGKRSLSVDDDLRIIFREKGNYIEVLMLDVGSHKSVYQ